MKLQAVSGGLAAAAMALPLAAEPMENSMEEVLVSGRHDTRTIDVSAAVVASPDIAELLRRAPGANVNRNGPLTGIPQYRGLFGPRVAVAIDGNLLAPAGPNWMDPPLSYAVTPQLSSLEVYRGIAPVSVAQESVGGAIDARVRRRDFGDADSFGFEGRLGGSAQSVNGGYQLDADLQASNRTHRLRLAGLLQQGDDAAFPDGDILPTEYQRQRLDIGYGLRLGDHSLQLEYGYNDTGETGTPALPMDIDYFEGDLYSLGYRFQPVTGVQVEASIYGSKLDHGMTNYHLRQAPAPANWRQNITATDNTGLRIAALWRDSSGAWRAGVDGFREEHDSEVDNPNNPAFFVTNFNGAEREVLGAWLEREQRFGERWEGEFGARYNRVRSDAGEVDGTPAMMMPPAMMLRDAFNAADREQTDNNIDLVAKLTRRFGGGLSAYLGLARKQRSPAYQERYLWLPLEATAGLADGQVYIGNIGLDSERASKVELGIDFRGERLTLSPRLFYNRVDDYIQGTPLSADHPATAMVRRMNAMNGTHRADPLQFNNVEAELYGFDMDWALQIDQNWSLSGVVNYVRGERRDIGDDLYRIAPPNTALQLNYETATWRVSVENVLYARQDRVSAINREQETAGYGIVNLRGVWQATRRLELAAGIDNLFDRTFRNHLAGYNRVANPDIEIGERLPGYGANLFGRVSYSF